MIKIICDRCGKEITGPTYHTINLYSYDTKPQYDYYATATSICNSSSRQDILATLNCTPIYCKECTDAIEKFIKGE